MPAATRDDFFALRAFNVEVASIKDGHNLRNQGSPSTQVLSSNGSNNNDSSNSSNNNLDTSNSNIALQLRMQWWRDAIGEIFQDGPSSAGRLSISCWNSPVVRALARAQGRCNFTRRFLERIVDARELDLETKQYETVNVLAAYGDNTVSSLLYLTLEACGVREEAADQCVSQAGIGIGLTTALRAAPYRLATGGEVTIPTELLRRGFPYHQLISTKYLAEGDSGPGSYQISEQDSEQWRDAVHHVALTATHHLMQAREYQSSIPKHARATLLPVVPALQYLANLNTAQYNVFDPTLTAGSRSDRLRLLVMMGRTWMTGVL